MEGNMIPGSRIEVGKKWYIESIHTQQISSDEIQKIYEIEQDMWAHGLGSYIWCDDCETISSKADVFWDLEKSIAIQTVSHIESVLWGWIPHCPNCSSDATHHIFGEQYRDEDIIPRYEFEKSFLTVYKDTAWEIRWFINAYIADFDTIYTKEFEPFYGAATKESVGSEIFQRFQHSMPKEMISMNNLWAEQNHVSPMLLYYLVTAIAESMSRDFSDTPWIYDSILWNITHGMYHIFWGTRLWADWWLKENVIWAQFKTDIMIHPYMPSAILENAWEGSKVFFSQNIASIKNFVKA